MTIKKTVYKMTEGQFKDLYIIDIKNGNPRYGGNMELAKKITKPFEENVKRWVREKYKEVDIKISYEEKERIDVQIL